MHNGVCILSTVLTAGQTFNHATHNAKSKAAYGDSSPEVAGLQLQQTAGILNTAHQNPPDRASFIVGNLSRFRSVSDHNDAAAWRESSKVSGFQLSCDLCDASTFGLPVAWIR